MTAPSGWQDYFSSPWLNLYNQPTSPTPTPAPAPAPAPTPQPPAAPGTVPPGSSAFTYLQNVLASYGIEFTSQVANLLQGAMLEWGDQLSMDLIMPDLQKTDAFVARFPGYAQAVQKGYVGSVSEYRNLEGNYRAILSNAGLPAGFYDDYSDFGNWIQSGVSPAEVQHRVEQAVTLAKQVDPTMRNLMAQYYGLSTGDVASYFLDPTRATPIIEHQYKTAGVAAWAARNGFDVSAATRFEDLVDKGITEGQAMQGYATARSLTDSVGRMASVYGESYGQTDAENDVFFGNDAKRRRIVKQEAATFGGSTSGATGSAQRQSY